MGPVGASLASLHTAASLLSVCERVCKASRVLTELEFDVLRFIWNAWLRKVRFRKYDISPGFRAGIGSRIWARGAVIIGSNFYMGRYSSIECNARIGENVLFGNFVSLAGRYDHHYQVVGVPIAHAPRIRSKDYCWKGLEEEVIIGDDVWIGVGAIILSGSRIGNGCIVGAGSVVVGELDPYSVYVGVPARLVGPRFSSEEDCRRHVELVETAEAKAKFAKPVRY